MANRVQQDLHGEGGRMASLLGRLEQLACAAPAAVAAPAQQVIAVDGADDRAAAQIEELCAAATGADMDEYIVRNSSGRPRPTEAPPAAATTPSVVGEAGRSLTLSSVSPVRQWELDLCERTVTIRSVSEEVMLQGSAVEEIERVPRKPCEVRLLVAGLDLDSTDGGEAAVLSEDGLSAAAAAAMDAAPPPLAAVRVVLPNPLSRELFVTALRSVAAASGPAGTDDALQASDAADAEPESAECLDGVDRAHGAALDAWVGHLGGGAAQRRLAEVLDECVPRGDTYGLYVVGQSVPNPAAAERAGEHGISALVECLGDHLGPDFVMLGSVGLPFLNLCAFVGRAHRRRFTAVRKCAASLLQTRQATGGVALAVSYMDSPLAFVCMHIPPEVDRRGKASKEAADVVRDRCARLNAVMADLQKQLPLWGDGGHALSSQYDATFLLGELNFELSEVRGSSRSMAALIGEGEWEALAMHDQLRLQQRAGRLLHGFEEAPPRHAPAVFGSLGEDAAARAGWFSRVLCAPLPGGSCETQLLLEEAPAFPAPDPATATAVQYRLRATWSVLAAPLDPSRGLPTAGCLIVLTGLRAAGLSPARSGSVSGSLLGLVKEASTDPFLSFAAPFLEPGAASPRTSTQAKTVEPSWEGERVVLRSFVAPAMLRGAHLLVSARHEAMIGSDVSLGEAAVSLGPMCGAQAAVHFATDLTRGGCLAGRLEGEVFISAAE